MLKNTSIVYVLAIEDIAQSPIVRSQVCNLLKALRQQTTAPIALVSLYPILNWLKFQDAIKALRADLRTDNIDLHVFPLFYLTRYFYIPRWLFGWFWLQALFASLWISLRLRPALVHCRSYPAAIVGKLVKRLCKAKLIFDTRALYPEEGASRKISGKAVVFRFASFRMWKTIERELIMNSDAVISVSKPGSEILKIQYGESTAHFLTIPTITGVLTLEDLKTQRELIRRKLNITPEQIVVSYVGTWFSQKPALILFKRLVSAMAESQWYFLIMLATKSEGDFADYAQSLKEMIGKQLPGPVACLIISVPQAEVVTYLAGADLAVQPADPPEHSSDHEKYDLMARTVLSIKFTEYLAGGLPVIVSRWHGAAATTAQSEDLGIIYDQATDAELSAWLERWRLQRGAYRQRAWSYARENFAIEVVAQRYLTLYQQLLDQN